MSIEEGKYTLEYYTQNDPDRSGPPFKYSTFYLSDALAAAWLNKDEDGQVVKIVRGNRTIFSEEELRRALERISQLEAKLGVPPRKIAEQVIREMGKTESEGQ